MIDPVIIKGILFKDWVREKWFTIVDHSLVSHSSYFIIEIDETQGPVSCKLRISFSKIKVEGQPTTLCRVHPYYWGDKDFNPHDTKNGFLIVGTQLQDPSSEQEWWNEIYTRALIKYN